LERPAYAGETGMESRALTVRQPATPSAPVIQGVESARERVYRFLVDTVGAVKMDVLLAELFQHGFNHNKPFHHIEFHAKDDLKEVAEAIVQAAEEDISGFSNQKLCYGLQLAQHSGRRNFELSVQGPGHSGSPLDSSSAMVPTLQAIVVQQMQHNQVIMETAIGSFAEQMKIQNETNAQREEQLQFLQLERTRYFEAKEAAMSLQHEREMQAKAQEKSDQRLDQLAATAINAAAPLVNKFVKQKLMPETATPLEGMTIALLSTLRKEQVDALLTSGLLSPAQASNLMHTLKTIQESFEQGGTGALPAGQSPPPDPLQANSPNSTVVVSQVSPTPPGSSGQG